MLPFNIFPRILLISFDPGPTSYQLTNLFLSSDICAVDRPPKSSLFLVFTLIPTSGPFVKGIEVFYRLLSGKPGVFKLSRLFLRHVIWRISNSFLFLSSFIETLLVLKSLTSGVFCPILFFLPASTPCSLSELFFFYS